MTVYAWQGNAIYIIQLKLFRIIQEKKKTLTFENMSVKGKQKYNKTKQ